MRYLITGITGFVAPHLANLLVEEGHEIFGLVRSSHGREEDIRDIMPDRNYGKIKFVYGDLTNCNLIEKIFKENIFDGVFHLGAQSHPPTSFIDPMGTFLANALGTVNIVESIRLHQSDCKLMYCSTSEVYGAVPEDKQPITENHPLNPINPYGVSKASADMYVRERANSCNLPFFVTRAFSHTGRGRGKKFSISSDAYQIVRILNNLQEKEIRVGTLTSKRCVMDVRDCVRAYYLLMRKFKSGEVYNIGGNEIYSIGELLDKMLDIVKLKGIKKIPDPNLIRPIDIPVQICDSTKCRKLTGWKPTIKIEDTLKELLDYWEKKIDVKKIDLSISNYLALP